MKTRRWLAMMGVLALAGVGCQSGVPALTDQEKAAIRQLDQSDAGQAATSGTRTDISLDGAGDLAYRHFSYERTAGDKGKGLQVVRRQANGSWRVVSEVLSVDGEPAGLLIPTSAMAADASPEVQNLARIVGRWTLKASEPKGAGTQSTRSGVMTCAWFPGGRNVICRTVGVVAGKEEVQVDQYSYDPGKRAYVVISNHSSSPAATGTLSVQPGAWIRTLDWEDDNGLKFKSRVTFHNLMIGGGDWKIEFSASEGQWLTVWTGTMTKEQ